MRFTSMPNARSSSDASSAFASCDHSDESDDDDCQVLSSWPPRPTNHREPVLPAASKSRDSSWSLPTWEFRSCDRRRPTVAKQEPRQQQQQPRRPATRQSNQTGPPPTPRQAGPTRRQTGRTATATRANADDTDDSDVSPELVDDSQQNLRKQWEAATLKRRTCHAMRSEGSKAGTYGWGGSQAPRSASVQRDTESVGGDSGTAETVQSNGHVGPVRGFSFQELSESTSTSSDSVVQVAADIKPRENGDAEPDEVESGTRRQPPAPASEAAAPATADPVIPEAPGNSLEDPPVNSSFARNADSGHDVSNNGFGKSEFAWPSCSVDVRKGVKRRYEPEEGFAAPWSQLKFRMNGTDGASTSGHVAQGIEPLKHVETCGDTLCNGDSEPALDADAAAAAAVAVPPAAVAVGHDLLGGREKLKETADFKLADEEEWKRRQQELQKQAQEARRLKERKRAEADRKNEVELRQKQRLEEIRQIQQKEERNMGLKNQIRSKVQAELERLAAGCRDMATLLRVLQIPVEGGICPSTQQVNAAYKKALLRYHPDRTSASVQGDPQRQVEAEETFKLITRMKQLLKPSTMIAMTAR